MSRPLSLRLIRNLDRFAELTGLVTAPLTVLIMVLTCIVVIARYAFKVGALPLQEVVVYLHAAIFMLGIGYTLKAQGHVRVDVLHQHFSRRTRAIVELLGTLLFLMPVGGFIFWTSLDYVGLSWSMQEGSADAGGLPGLYLLKALIPTMAILLLIQGVADLLRAWATLSGLHD
jgi:TRAP-type mannitol/chloroaromatic compound transport system permease small subunit